MIKKKHLMTVYNRLLETYGPQHWWPAKTPFEVMIGAILTQNTTWKNVEQAIRNLQQAGCLDADAMIGLKQEQLADLIRPSGYFNIKAKRLRNFLVWYMERGGHTKLAAAETTTLRDSLLGVNGIGPETADDILLYAFERPVFVIDTYTRRLFARFGVISGEEDYEILRGAFESNMDRDVPMYNEYHALIVRHAKEKCDQGQDCKHCCVEAPLNG
jgi:endonuclease-3 related protein